MNTPALPAATRRPPPPACIAALEQRFGERLSLAQAVREHHGRDESPYPAVPPDAVVFAESTEDVVDAVKLCAAHAVPLIAFGSGSSLEGHVLAIQGGVSLDLSRMNKVLAVHADDLTATVQAGVTRKQLNDELRDTGLFFPIDPGADASLGGMAATRASGTNAVRYGTMRENVVSLTVVTAQGRVIRTARRARKSAAGYDLTRLFVGSEGTLGIITEVTVRLYPQPEAVSAAVCNFETVDAAVSAVIETSRWGCRWRASSSWTRPRSRAGQSLQQAEPARNARCCCSSSTAAPPASRNRPRWSRTSRANTAAWISNGPTQPEDRNRLWAARHNAYFATLAVAPRCARHQHRCLRADFPPGRMHTAKPTATWPAPVFLHCMVGHVGDGNFHVQMLLDPDNPRPNGPRPKRSTTGMVRRALAMDGTCSGEHGVGLHKMRIHAGGTWRRRARS